MTLNQLSYFYQAAVLEHFNQAAEKMNITEPSLSRSIAALEDELGVTLFEKRGRNVILTKAGEIFLEHVSTILDDVKRAENKMHQIATDGGHIDIAYVSPLAKVFIPTIVRSFLTEKENKNITFNFFQDITSVNIEGLKKGRYDIIFGSYSPDENGIDFVPIIRQEIVAILPPGHPLTLKDTMEATDFADYPVLGYARHSGLGKYTRSFFKKHDVSPNFICESPDENGIASLEEAEQICLDKGVNARIASRVAQGCGIALVADVDAIHRDDICIRHLVSHESFSHTVYMGYMTGKYQLPAIKRFIEFVRESCS